MSLRRRRCWSRWFPKENSGCHSPARISTFIYQKQTYIMLFSYSKWGKINHIVNNAGFTFDKMLHTTSDDTFDIIMKIHVRAPFRLIRQAAPYFRLKVCPSKPIFILLSPESCYLNLAWTTWEPLNYQCILYFRSARKRRTSQLCLR